jgi:hypothetical protein
LALVLDTRDARHVPIDAPIWREVWKTAPPTDCSSLVISILVNHHIHEERGTYASTRFEVMTFPKQTMLSGKLTIRCKKRLYVQVDTPWDQEEGDEFAGPVASPRGLNGEEKACDTAMSVINRTRLDERKAYLLMEHPIRMSHGALYLGPSHMTLPCDHQLHLWVTRRAGITTYSCNRPGDHTRQYPHGTL